MIMIIMIIKIYNHNKICKIGKIKNSVEMKETLICFEGGKHSES